LLDVAGKEIWTAWEAAGVSASTRFQLARRRPLWYLWILGDLARKRKTPEIRKEIRGLFGRRNAHRSKEYGNNSFYYNGIIWSVNKHPGDIAPSRWHKMA